MFLAALTVAAAGGLVPETEEPVLMSQVEGLSFKVCHDFCYKHCDRNPRCTDKCASGDTLKLCLNGQLPTHFHWNSTPEPAPAPPAPTGEPYYYSSSEDETDAAVPENLEGFSYKVCHDFCLKHCHGNRRCTDDCASGETLKLCLSGHLPNNFPVSNPTPEPAPAPPAPTGEPYYYSSEDETDPAVPAPSSDVEMAADNLEFSNGCYIACYFHCSRNPVCTDQCTDSIGPFSGYGALSQCKSSELQLPGGSDEMTAPESVRVFTSNLVNRLMNVA